MTPKKKGPSAKAYEHASDKASFKRNIEPKNKKIKKEMTSKKVAKEETKTKKKGFLWW